MIINRMKNCFKCGIRFTEFEEQVPVEINSWRVKVHNSCKDSITAELRDGNSITIRKLI